MSKPVDYENLRNVVIEGTAQACRDAGLTHFTVACDISPVLHVNPRTGNGIIAPEVTVEVIELSPENAASIIAAQNKSDGN